MTCKHCGREISNDQFPVHLDGGYRWRHSCDPRDSNLPYGYAADAEDSACSVLCVGSRG